MANKTLSFIKMAGAGNDFLVMDAQKGINYQKLGPEMCDRTNGVGADGLIILDKSKKSDYRMRIINADGSEAEMCGNGARCLVAYIVKTKKPRKKLFSVETLAGEILGQAKGETAVVRLSDPKDYAAQIPLNVNGREIHVQYIDTGVPHTIIYVEGLSSIDVAGIGPSIRYHEHFKPRGTNVNFVEQINDSLVAVRTYERGVENETRACGTGAVAVALVSYLKVHPNATNQVKAKMQVRTASTEILDIVFDLIDGKITNVWLTGSAKFIAEGRFFLK